MTAKPGPRRRRVDGGGRGLPDLVAYLIYLYARGRRRMTEVGLVHLELGELEEQA